MNDAINKQKDFMEDLMNVLDTRIHDTMMLQDDCVVDSDEYKNLQKQIDMLISKYTQLQERYDQAFCQAEPEEKHWYDRTDWGKVGLGVFITLMAIGQTRWCYLRQQEGDIYKSNEAWQIPWSKLL